MIIEPKRSLSRGTLSFTRKKSDVPE